MWMIQGKWMIKQMQMTHRMWMWMIQRMRMMQRPLDARDSANIQPALPELRLRRSLTVHGHGHGYGAVAVVVLVMVIGVVGM